MKTKTTNQLTGALLAMFVIMLFAFNACSNDDSGADSDPDPTNAINVNDYLLSLPSWESFSPILQDNDNEGDPEVVFDCDEQYVQTTTPCDITRTPEEIVTHDPGSSILYLGSLIQGNGYVGGLGSIRSLPIYQRAPISVSISFQMSNNSRTVDNPNLTTVNQAVAELIEAAQNAGHVSGSSIFYNEKTSHSLQQTAIELGLSYKFMKNSVKTNLQWNSNTETNTVSAYFKQKMFTVSMGIPQRPSDIFSADFTQALLDEQINLGRIGPNNLPVYVSNIVYGRMMMFTMTSNYTETEMKAALDASYSGINGNISAEHLEVLGNSEIQLVTIGGDANAALGYLKTGELKEFFKNDAPLTTAVPIAYTLRNLGDNQIAKVSETTDYEMVQHEKAKLYTSEQEWREDLQSLDDMQLVTWNITRDNLNKADESDKFQTVTNNQLYMFDHITFSSPNTDYPFDFYIKSNDPAAQGHRAALVNLDYESDTPGFPIEYISIGDVDDFDNDDFEIGVTDGNVHGIGFWVIGNSYGNNEFLEVHVYDPDSTTGGQCLFLTTDEHINNFVGVISPVPIKDIIFDEDVGGDDIAIGEITFGYKE